MAFDGHLLEEQRKTMRNSDSVIRFRGRETGGKRMERKEKKGKERKEERQKRQKDMKVEENFRGEGRT
jgi:hypothetical protein